MTRTEAAKIATRVRKKLSGERWRQLAHRHSFSSEYELLNSFYILECKTMPDMSFMFGLTATAIRERLIKNKIPLRPPNRKFKIHGRKNYILDELERDGIDIMGILNSCKSIEVAAYKIGVCTHTISRYLKRREESC